MSSSPPSNTAIPMPLPDDADDVTWALQTAAVQWGRGAFQDAIVWLRRGAESAIEASKWSRAADLNATATKLEKQIAKGSASISSLPPESARAAILPSFPVPSRASTQSLPSLSEALSGSPVRRAPQRTLPTPPAPKFRSAPAPYSGRASIDIEAGVGELTEEELRAIEAEDVAPGALDQWRASRPQPSRPPPSGLPAFQYESARPPPPSSSSSPLPAFSLESSVKPPPITGSPDATARLSESSLPSFPLDAVPSSLPPVSRWPTMGSRGTSHIPPHPALPSFDAVPPSRPFVDDGDDGAPGIDDEALQDSDFEEVEPFELSVSEPPVAPSTSRGSRGGGSELDLVEIDSSRSSAVSRPPNPLHQLTVRSGLASTRARTSSAPLPPALPPQGRPSTAAPRTVRAAPLSSGAPASAESSRPPVPTRSGAPIIEPRMPKRTLSYASPLDFGNRPKSEPAQGSPSQLPTSNAPTIRRIEAAEPVSVPPPSARSLEPEDLPTVSSPTLSTRPPSETPGSYDDARAESRRLSFRFEEPRTLDRHFEEPRSTEVSQPPPLDQQAFVESEEPLASLPPVSIQQSDATPSDDPDADPVILSGIRLADVRGFSELPVSAHRLLAQSAHIETLSTGEEASFFSVALVLDGWVALMPAIADTTCATAVVGEVVFTEGTLSDGLMLRVVAGQDSVAVATWDTEAIAAATKDLPWLADDLKLLADGFQALAGACLGPLGDRLDDSLRSIVTSRCEVRTLMPGEQMCAAGKPVPGMHIIGGGDIELVDESGRVMNTHGTGEFLFAPQVLAGGVAPYSARAGNKGALVLFAPRMAAHELLVSVPPLLEILAE